MERHYDGFRAPEQSSLRRVAREPCGTRAKKSSWTRRDMEFEFAFRSREIRAGSALGAKASHVVNFAVAEAIRSLKRQTTKSTKISDLSADRA